MTQKEKTEMAKNTKAKKKTKKRAAGASIVLSVVLLFVLLVVLACVVTLRELNKIRRVDPVEETMVPVAEIVRETDEGLTEEDDTVKPEEIDFGAEKVETVQENHVVNLLLIGQDARPGETRARSDSMIVCSINKETKKITLCSLMRDMLVPIPGYGYSRINHSYAWGGMKLLDQVLEEDFGLIIDGNVEVNFDGFVDVMDRIGPLEIELKEYELWYMNDGTYWGLKEGNNMLNGEQLLRYARMRYAGKADWERTDRQRYVLSAAFNKMKDLSVSELMKLADTILPYLSTDLTNSEILEYIYLVASNRMTIGETFRFPLEGTYSAEIVYGMDVLVPNLEENSKALQEYLYNK